MAQSVHGYLVVYKYFVQGGYILDMLAETFFHFRHKLMYNTLDFLELLIEPEEQLECFIDIGNEIFLILVC